MHLCKNDEREENVLAFESEHIRRYFCLDKSLPAQGPYQPSVAEPSVKADDISVPKDTFRYHQIVQITQHEELRLSLCMCADATVAIGNHFCWSHSLQKTDVACQSQSYAKRNGPNLSCIKAAALLPCLDAFTSKTLKLQVSMQYLLWN